MTKTQSEYQIDLSVNLQINPNLSIECLTIGQEKSNLIIIDDFLSNPEQLIAYAQQGSNFQKVATDFYPGIRKPITGNYPTLISNLAIKQIKKLVLTTKQLDLCEQLSAQIGLCSLSLTTTQSERLKPIQSIPHFDNSNPLQLAAIHYLCDEKHGGTSFYCHNETGYESINPQRLHTYAGMLKQQVVNAQFTGQSYINGDNLWFTKIKSINAKFNRVVIFRGNLLHAGNINPMQSLSDDPKTGRLTANVFMSF